MSRTNVKKGTSAKGGIIFSIFVGLFSGVFFLFWLHGFLEVRAARSWSRVEATILEHTHEQYSRKVGKNSHRTDWRSRVRYQYEYLGKPYSGSRYSFDGDAKAPSSLKVGTKIDFCRVNPMKPSESVLSLEGGNRWGILIFAVLAEGASLFIFIYSIRQRKNPLEAAAPEAPADGDDAERKNPLEAAAPEAPADGDDAEWTPMKSTGHGSFRTHRLRGFGPDRFGVVLSVEGWLFFGVFVLVGTCVAVAGLVKLCTGDWWDGGMFLLFGAFFGGIPLLFIRAMRKRGVFDRIWGAYWNDKNTPEKMGDPSTLKDFTPFKKIRAIQLLASERAHKGGTYLCCQLNLVLQGGRRVHVMEHANVAAIRRDASAIAGFVGGVPVWDRIAQKEQKSV